MAAMNDTTTEAGNGEPGADTPGSARAGAEMPGAGMPGGTTGDAGPRRVTRSRDHRILGGVASGIARYLGVDPVLIRLGFVLATLLGGVGILAYVAGWLLIPEESTTAPSYGRPRANVRQLLGFAVLGIGLLVVLGNFDLWVDEQAIWAVGLIAIGAAVLWARGRESDDDVPPPGSPPPSPPSSTPPGAPAPGGPIVAPPQPPSAPPPPGAPSWPPAPPPAAGPLPAPPPPPAAGRRRPSSVLGLLAISALFVWTGLAIAIDLGPRGVLAGMLIVLGLALVVGAWRGRARWLVIPGVVVSLIAVGASAIDIPLSGGIGERQYRPQSFATLEDEYELGMGSLDLDLRALDFSGRTQSVEARVGLGELVVSVPDAVRVVVDGHVSMGELVLFGDEQSGTGVDDRAIRPGVEGGGTLRLDVDGGIGSIEVIGTHDGGVG